ncbi:MULTISPECIES: lanthionine synthetase LanC family protein [Peptoniphilus]|uniref:lanthionine synthetase LanC family protein n=3 Tax=Peptoniphilaceae TaxID=1570339 RepID=UPI002904EA01|nr:MULTISPECIES: lanthionine synthetase LanC family protein [Peptoniphilus]MDU1044050.1 lanthionine synthetase LanC family protein [Peptoniphilus rhinitidis]MDU1954998.1 lanthionine synthetase LanC family protein [Peptoniphilus lacydonensis]MDU5275252.1 lanthionine synthetase LanC family protein [Peptoniphilus lacydonensis]MDU5377624.1 lanthionine synthetase LanC family protein [Peptoniphilus lacydonensis]MDU5437666.1 lanthionine synthetase LanC family protein [Peptoniphilus lacydonensis]
MKNYDKQLVNTKKYLVNSNKLNLIEYFLLSSKYIDNSELFNSMRLFKNLVESGYFEDITSTSNLEYLLYITIYVNELTRIGIFEKFSNSMNLYLLKLSEKFVLSYNVKNEEFLFFLFPIIGKVISYLSEFDLNLDVLINFVIENIEPRSINGKDIIGFYIRDTNEDFNKQFPNGIFPLGMAHGSLGVLFALSKLYKNNKLNSDIYVNYLYNLYEIFSKKEDNFSIFPNFVTYEEYKNKDFKTNIKQYRAAWCSGNLITSFILFKVCQNMNWNKKAEVYYRYVIEILCQDIKAYNLEIPIICHGYSFPLMIINIILREKDLNIYDGCKCEILKCREKELNDMLFYTLSSSNITYVIKNKFKNNYSILYGITGMILALDKSNNSSLEKILNIK